MGIGEAIARSLAKEGANLILLSRSEVGCTQKTIRSYFDIREGLKS